MPYSVIQKVLVNENGTLTANFINNNCVIISTIDGGLNWFELNENNQVNQIKNVHSNGSIISSTFNGKEFATSTINGRIRIWDIENAKMISEIESGPGSIWHIKYHSKIGKLAAASQNGQNAINVWSTENLSNEPEIFGNNFAQTFYDVAWSNNGKFLAVSSLNGIIVVFNTNDKSILNSYQAHSSAARCVAFTKDDTCVVSAGDNGQILIFNLKQNEPKQILSGHKGAVLSLQLSNDGKRIATSGVDRSIRVWSSHNGALLHTFHEHADKVWGVCWSADDRVLVSVGDDGNACWHDVSDE